MNIYDEFAHYYDAEVANFVEDVPFYREMARRTGGPVLELMCGSGRLLLPLAEDLAEEMEQEGYTLTGVDSSMAMLEIARARLATTQRDQHVRLLPGDVRSVALPANHFALVFVALNSFMHLSTIEDQLAALATVRHTLASDGVLILDLFNPDTHNLSQEDNRLVLERTFWMNGQEVFKFTASESDMAKQVNSMSCFYDTQEEGGIWRRRLMRFPMRWFYRYELEHLLARAGFVLESLYGSYDLDEYTSESTRMIAVASASRQ